MSNILYCKLPNIRLGWKSLSGANSLACLASLAVMIEPNKLDCYITIDYKTLPETNTPAFWPICESRRKRSIVNMVSDLSNKKLTRLDRLGCPWANTLAFLTCLSLMLKESFIRLRPGEIGFYFSPSVFPFFATLLGGSGTKPRNKRC